MSFHSTTEPLISVIIPCYNQGIYLPEALKSVYQQDYPAIEIVVVDDGSTDSTRQIAQQYPAITYIYQANQGLAAARNTGAAHSTGHYLVFLDADDWLLPHALHTNGWYLRHNPHVAFVSGGYDKVYTAEDRVERYTQEITTNHYCLLLRGNYISMIAAVMFQRWVFDSFSYDTSLQACEDYDLFLRIARVHPIGHHTEPTAAYRIHATNMSRNPTLMLQSALTALQGQAQSLRSEEEKNAYARGQVYWRHYYANELYRKMKAALWPSSTELATLFQLKPSYLLRYVLTPPPAMRQLILKKSIPTAVLRQLRRLGGKISSVPAVGSVALGDFKRISPFSRDFGYERGGPIDRYYIEKFLRQEAQAIRGRVLEIADNNYTLRFGSGVTHSDILHIDASNPKATIIADLSAAPHLPADSFDCIILTQTLHLIYDYKQALATCYRILKPGGTLLITVPGITPIDRSEWRESWYWSFTDVALQRLLHETFPGSTLEISSFGNVFVASAFLYGMGVPEVTTRDLDIYDPQFQVINTAKIIKS